MIARIAPAAEPGTRSIGVTIELANPKETLRAGQYAVVGATLPDETQRLTVPATAVGQTSGQDHVWVIENGTLARRAIMVGRRDARDGRVEVLQGIQPASTVLAARFENLREGAKAVVVAGRWGIHIDGAGQFIDDGRQNQSYSEATFSCEQTGPIAKCVTAGYKPWLSTTKCNPNSGQCTSGRPVDNYLKETPHRLTWSGINVVNWHRPMETYLQLLLAQGLTLSFFAEPKPVGGDPDFVERGTRVPWFHVMEWRKP